MRIMLYNLYRGAEGRLPLVTETVRTLKPDILGCLEAVGWEGKVAEIAATFGYPHHCFAKANTKYDMALFTDATPQHTQQTKESFWHTTILTTYTVEPIGTLAVLLVHLNPREEDARVKETERIVTMMKPFKHAIVFGDLNSLSPHDPYDQQKLLALLQEKRINKFGTEHLRFDVISLLEKAGFIDVMTTLKKPFVATVPSPMNEDPEHAAPLRLDYIFITPSLAPYLTHAEVVRTPTTDHASDHYPVIADFSF